MGKNWDAGICNEKSGFLFSHECHRPPLGSCKNCQKPVCEDHAHELVKQAGEIPGVGADMICTSCAKKDIKRNSHGLGGASSRRQGHYDDHDPYFYGGYYYGATYHDNYRASSRGDPNDFTEADSESLASEADEAFESDMSES